MRRAATTVVMALAATMLSACGSSPYCSAIESDASVLNKLGAEKTTKAYTQYAKVLGSYAKTAPESVQDDWAELAKVTQGVLDAQAAIGVPLEDMDDAKKIAGLSNAQLDSVNNAYKAFNNTKDARAAVVKNVKQECDITLQ